MAQYIDKSALVAEIKRRENICKKVVLDLRTEKNKDYYQGKAEAYKETLDLLDTLEVKEVDLEREIKSSMNNLCELGCYTQSLLDNPGDYEGFAKPFPKEVDDEIANFAKHFFELGIKVAQKGE